MGALFRLIAAGWILVRVDALIPRELEPHLPQSLRWLGRVLRLVAGGAAGDDRPGRRLAAAFERLGPVAIKLGQLLSTRADIFGSAVADDLARLKDRLPPFPQEEAEATVAADLGRPLGESFARFGPSVAAASLAQAHDANLPDGRRVAVKVLRPGVERRVAADIQALALAARIVDRLAPPARRLDPKALVATVAQALRNELDLRVEAGAAAELAEVMARDDWMIAPVVIWEAVGRRVLTLTWAEGAPLSDPATLLDPALDRPALANALIRGFLAQALEHGVFHADLHEGNLFVRPPARLTAVDFGIVGRLSEAERRWFATILWGFLRRDYRRIAEVHFEAGYVPATHDVEAFARALRSVGEPIFGRPASEVSMARLLTQLFEVTAAFDMRLRPELVLLQKTMVTVEGVARRIDPDADIWAASQPVVERWIRRELSPPAQARRLAERAMRAVEGLERLAISPATPTVFVRRDGPVWTGMALLAAGAALALAIVAVAT